MATDLDHERGPKTRRGPSRGWGVAAALLLAGVLGDGCYRGGDRDKDPPPGLPGGLCLAPDGHCEEGTCNRDRNYCYDPTDPCHGFFCGGDDRGFCFPDPQSLQPTCMCEAGYTNEQYDLYCCPDPSLGIFDPNCTMAGAGAGGGDESTG